MYINSLLDARITAGFNHNSVSEYDLVVRNLFKVEGAVEVRYPNDVVKTYYLPVNSKILDYIKNDKDFIENIEEDFVYPNVYFHEALFDSEEKVGRLSLSDYEKEELDYINNYCSSIKHGVNRPNDVRPMAFQKKVSDKRAKPLFSIKEETDDVHFTKDTFDGMSRKYLKASFKILKPDEVRRQGEELNKHDIMSYLQPGLPFKLYGLYTQEKFLNANLRYVMGFSWMNGKSQRRIMSQDRNSIKAVGFSNEESPESYKKLDYSKGILFSWKYYRQLKSKEGKRIKFYGGDLNSRKTKIPFQRDYPLNVGLALLNFPQMDVNGSVVEKNQDPVYFVLEKINRVAVEGVNTATNEVYNFSEYSLFDYSAVANFFLPFEMEPIIEKIVKYRWAEFYKEILLLNKNGISG